MNAVGNDAPFQNPHPRPLAPHVSSWMSMIIIDEELCPWKDINNTTPRKEKGKRWSLCISFRYVRYPLKLFWLLTWITCFNVGNNFTTTIASKFWPPFWERWQPLSFLQQKNMWTSQPLTKMNHGFIVVKLLNFLLRDFWMLENIKSIRQLYS